MLPEGLDLDGDGEEEQLVISRGNLLQVGGDPEPRVTDPNGSAFFPQVYGVTRLKEPAWTGAIDGARVVALEAFPWAGDNRTVFVARDNYLGVYDGKRNIWAFEWVPLAKLTAAALVESGGHKATLLAATADGLLWRMGWESILSDKPTFTVQRLEDPAHRIVAHPQRNGAALIVGEQGLYLMDRPDRLRLVARGSYNDAAFLPTDGPGNGSIVATTSDGKVVRFDPTN